MVHERTDETMITTLQLLAEKPSIPTTTAWYLADLGEARGKQELFTKQHRSGSRSCANMR